MSCTTPGALFLDRFIGCDGRPFSDDELRRFELAAAERADYERAAIFRDELIRRSEEKNRLTFLGTFGVKLDFKFTPPPTSE